MIEFHDRVSSLNSLKTFSTGTVHAPALCIHQRVVNNNVSFDSVAHIVMNALTNTECRQVCASIK